MTKTWVPYTMDMLLAIWQILDEPVNVFEENHSCLLCSTVSAVEKGFI